MKRFLITIIAIWIVLACIKWLFPVETVNSARERRFEALEEQFKAKYVHKENRKEHHQCTTNPTIDFP